eukprot:CAMPEP_0198197958 /NCGR_PEP_ID=MMETSP1445-20131203/1511_1 /TAXON_ID=36898 /ORGANISM="Pyramimonas sp., Strain CCMP2087" /LENGTH=325 /DNA_ID=CAMNT_0043867383 /DNA_START=86 /DNA_END=1060 /DNA_ORIENTATION=+
MSDNADKRKREEEGEAPKPGANADGTSAIQNGWFSEFSTMWPGQAMSIKMGKTLHEQRSDFQDVLVFESETFGNVLVLDGVIQCTERDEFSYQEMIVHLPFCALPEPPKRVLVIGGGDGGVLREMLRYKSVEKADMAEIDAMVPEVSKKFFPGMSTGFTDPRANVQICDGLKFVEDTPAETYDVIIVDSSDPVGPAEVLFQKPFFDSLHKALKPGGIVCTQAECLWLHLPVIKDVASMCKEVFKGGKTTYAYCTIPTYPSGQIGFMLCKKAGGKDFDFNVASTPPPTVGSESSHESVTNPLRYYNAAIHPASFVLPEFARVELEP